MSKVFSDKGKAQESINKLDKKLSKLLAILRAEEDQADEAHNESLGDQLADYASQVTKWLSEIQDDELTKLDNSGQLSQAIKELAEANDEIDAAIKAGAKADADIATLAAAIEVASATIQLFTTV